MANTRNEAIPEDAEQAKKKPQPKADESVAKRAIRDFIGKKLGAPDG